MTSESNDEQATVEAIEAFEREIGVTGISWKKIQIGNQEFIKFPVHKNAPLYIHALHESQKRLPASNPYRGALSLEPGTTSSFPESLEAKALLTLLTRSTREVSQDTSLHGYVVPYIPFQKREDHTLAQAASHIVRGRRGVGKSTLIRRAADLLKPTAAIISIIDMQGYSSLSGDDLLREVMYDACIAFAESASRKNNEADLSSEILKLRAFAEQLASGELTTPRAPIVLKRVLSALTKATQGNVFLFLDDFHLIAHEEQPSLLHFLHGALKGANGWLKVAGLSSLLNTYSAKTGQGLQVPGDAQYISLDLTLENPETAEDHLKIILEEFLKAIGYTSSSAVIPQAAFRRLAWANAGVPRDFLQMFARSLEHAQRNRRAAITLSDVNVAIGEFGQQKMKDLELDARNEAGILRKMLEQIEQFCLDEKKVNAFLVRSDNSKERVLVQILSDLRMVHLIHQSITPDRAGQRFEAFIIDYSLFTGFRRRPNVREMIPKESQFKASELRALPKVAEGFFLATS